MSLNPIPLNRRNFIKFAGLGCITPALTFLNGCTHQKFYNPDQDILLGGGMFKKNDELHHVLAVVNLTQQETQLVELDFLAHGIIIDPDDKKRLIAFEKNGPGAAAINLNDNFVTAKITTGGDRYFNGHGVFVASGDALFCTETFFSDHNGTIVIRDGKNLETLDEFPTYGDNPHECKLIDDGAVLLVTNAGSSDTENSQPAVSYIDVQTQQLIERVTLSNEQLNTGHIAIAADGSLIVTSAPREGLEQTQSGGVSIRSGKQPMLTMTQPELVIKQMTGEALSIAIDNKHNIAAVTHPEANMVTFWSIDKRELVKAMSVPQPRGITLSLDEKSFIISYDINTSMALVSTKDLTANTGSIMQPTYISGSHIINWSKTLTEIMPQDVYS